MRIGSVEVSTTLVWMTRRREVLDAGEWTVRPVAVRRSTCAPPVVGAPSDARAGMAAPEREPPMKTIAEAPSLGALDARRFFIMAAHKS